MDFRVGLDRWDNQMVPVGSLSRKDKQLIRWQRRLQINNWPDRPQGSSPMDGQVTSVASAARTLRFSGSKRKEEWIYPGSQAKRCQSSPVIAGLHVPRRVCIDRLIPNLPDYHGPGSAAPVPTESWRLLPQTLPTATGTATSANRSSAIPHPPSAP